MGSAGEPTMIPLSVWLPLLKAFAVPGPAPSCLVPKEELKASPFKIIRPAFG